MVKHADGSPLAIDEALVILDSLISRLQTSTPADPSVPPVIEAHVISAKKGEAAVRPEFTIDCAKPSDQQHEHFKGSVLNRPGKKPLKLPGGAADKSSKPCIAEQPSTAKGSENQENFEKALVQVGLVLSVGDHPISEKLYVCKVEVAVGQFRQVVAGLKNFIPVSELEGKKVALILNLKPAKLAGQVSEAMILAGATHTDGVESVKVLEPPSSAAVGDRIYLEGHSPSASPAKQLSSKIWEKVVPLLTVQGGLATFDKIPLVTSSGTIKVPHLPDKAGIH